jgi:hypothetical protein
VYTVLAPFCGSVASWHHHTFSINSRQQLVMNTRTKRRGGEECCQIAVYTAILLKSSGK